MKINLGMALNVSSTDPKNHCTPLAPTAATTETPAPATTAIEASAATTIDHIL
jgi:hypothetical protein